MELAKERNAMEPVLLYGDAFYGDKIKIQHFQLTVMLFS
jgi:hypothetical protein